MLLIMMFFSKLRFSTCNLLDWAAALNSKNIRLAESRMDSGWMPWEPQIRADYHHSMFLVEVPIKQGANWNLATKCSSIVVIMTSGRLRYVVKEHRSWISYPSYSDQKVAFDWQQKRSWHGIVAAAIHGLCNILLGFYHFLWIEFERDLPWRYICILLNYHPWILTAGYPKWWFGKWFSSFNLNVAIFGINSLNFWGVSPFFYVWA